MALSTEDREEISNTIRLVVNGNIKRVETKLDEHISNHDKMVTMYEDLVINLTPVAEAVGWINTTKKFVVWVAGFVLAGAGIVTVFK